LKQSTDLNLTKKACMLTLHPRQIKLLDQHQEQQFRVTLRKYIQQEYPAYAPVSPAILTRLIGFGLARARSYGFAWQSSLGQFVYLMAAVAPNFDLHPAIHSILANADLPAEKRIASLTERLPPGVWAEAADTASTIGWFLDKDGFKFDRHARILLALANALPVITAPSETLVQRALTRAEALGFLTEDSQFVFAACCLHYGENFELQALWAKELLTPAFTSQAKTALLRVRLALDAGLWL
jgi:hypothetical protein